MADFWKSNPKKFCDFCKCWIADNRPSIDFHEKGKNHQQNVKRKISEVKKKAVDKRKKDAEFSKEFAAMEAAALKAVQKDLKNNPNIVGSNDLQNLVKDSNKSLDEKANTDVACDTQPTTPWVVCQTPQGHTYYYNQKTGESKWTPPPDLANENGASSSKYENQSDGNATFATIESALTSQKAQNEDEESAASLEEETDAHPLLGGWTVVHNSHESESFVDNSTTKVEPTPSDDSSAADGSSQVQDSTDPESLNEASRKRSSIFKERTLQSISSINSGETVTFKKRKLKNNRSTRKRLDDE